LTTTDLGPGCNTGPPTPATSVTDTERARDARSGTPLGAGAAATGVATRNPAPNTAPTDAANPRRARRNQPTPHVFRQPDTEATAPPPSQHQSQRTLAIRIAPPQGGLTSHHVPSIQTAKPRLTATNIPQNRHKPETTPATDTVYQLDGNGERNPATGYSVDTSEFRKDTAYPMALCIVAA
jgi:hypothetical protein